MAQPPTVSIKAYAKVNLGLQILGKRDDGYHDLVTVFQTVDLADKLTVSPGGCGLQMTVSGDFAVPADGDNLCLQAARAYLQAAGADLGVSISLHKRIPVGAGLGGGSSDAAATLRALHRIIGAEVDLHPLAASLGSDVAFFLLGGTALGEGRGERLTPCPTPAIGHIVLAKPQLSISTREAYSFLGPDDFSDGTHTRRLFERLRRGEAVPDCCHLVTNDFQRPVERRWPAVRSLREAMMSAGACASMLSGSGSCMFAIFAEAADASRCAEMLAAEGYWQHGGNMVHYGPDQE